MPWSFFPSRRTGHSPNGNRWWRASAGFEAAIGRRCDACDQRGYDLISNHQPAAPPSTCGSFSSSCPMESPLVSADSFSLRGNERNFGHRFPSGAGKSTLFPRHRRPSGRLGTGSIAIPAKASLMMLPQRPYLPIGIAAGCDCLSGGCQRLQVRTRSGDALIFGGVLPDARIREIGEEAHWNRMLSLGEQQRLGIAPRDAARRRNICFLDEADRVRSIEASEGRTLSAHRGETASNHHHINRSPQHA